MQSRGRLVTFALLAVCAQVLRNWLMLHAVGVHVSIFDSMALLIVMFTVGQLPIGPSIRGQRPRSSSLARTVSPPPPPPAYW